MSIENEIVEENKNEMIEENIDLSDLDFLYNENKYKCKYCNRKITTSSYQLNRHINSHIHNDNKQKYINNQPQQIEEIKPKKNKNKKKAKK